MPVFLPPVPAAGRFGTTNFLIPGFVPNNSSTMALTANQVRYFPVIVATPITLDQLALEISSASGAGTTVRMGIYGADTDWQATALIVDAGTVAADSLGVKTASINVTLAPGRYLFACNSDSTPTLRAIRGAIPSGGFVSTLGATMNMFKNTGNQAYGVFPNPGTAGAFTNANQQYEYGIFCRVSVP